MDRRAIPAAAKESIWLAEDGHELRRIDWHGEGSPSAAEKNIQARGSILFLPGRGDNYEKYLELLDEWHHAGWRVTAADWRGQAGSGRLGNDHVTGHIDDFSTWIADLAVLWQTWKAVTPPPHVLAGHSMGGHLIMRALIEGKVDPDAVVLSAPMLDMTGPPLPLAILHGAAKIMRGIGDETRQAWKWSEKPGELPARRRHLLTHDDDRYEDELWWREHRPELVMGPGSWGWVERAYASTKVLKAAGAMEQVHAPVLILSTREDKLVNHEACMRAVERLPNGELVEFGEEAHHEILREVDAVRNRAMDEIARFLDRAVPPA
ncbi:MAG: alpha/beta hydrolase [Erythrobacter sp.]